jgi:hypothetical protein
MTASPSPPTPTYFPFNLRPVLAWTAILVLIGLTVLSMVIKAGTIARWMYPANCFLVAILLYFRYPNLYLGFTWWVWFLSPFVRRVIDLHNGWVEPNPVLLAPFLVTLLTLVSFARYLPSSYRWGGIPFLMALIGVLHGLLVGLFNFSPTVLIIPLLNWMTPILFGFHLLSNWRSYPQLRQTTQTVFLWGVTVMGAYGVVQYLTAPAWDRLWLIQQETEVFGTPEPLGIRVFSTMASPQPFACVMAAGLILLLSNRGGGRFLAAGVGYLSLLLSLARSGWLGWMVSLVLYFPSLKQRLQIQLILTLLAITILVLPLTTVEPFADVINSRISTLFNLQQDTSYNARMTGYSDALGLALTQVTGQGLAGSIISDTLGANDSGILTLLFLLGWLGTLPYMGGLVLLLLAIARKQEGGDDAFAAAARAVALGAFVQMGLNETMLSVFGMVLWGFLGISLAAQRYYWYQRQLELQQPEEVSQTPLWDYGQ